MSDSLTPNKTLSIRISTDGFCFCSYTPTDPASLQYFSCGTDDSITLAANLSKAMEECPFINTGASHEIKAIIETVSYTMLPSDYDEREEYTAYYRNCFPKSEDNVEIVANKLHAQGYTVIFPVNKDVAAILQQMGSVSYFTPASILMGYISNAPFEEKKYMLLHLEKEQMLIIAVNEGKVEFANSFEASNKEDLIFYMLSVWKELGFSQTEDTVYLCGDKGIEEIQLFVSRFIKNRRRINPNELFPSSLLNKKQGVPFDMQALILCE